MEILWDKRLGYPLSLIDIQVQPGNKPTGNQFSAVGDFSFGKDIT